MKRSNRFAAGFGAALGLAIVVAPVTAGAGGFPHGPGSGSGAEDAVFVQTDNVAGNQVVAYSRHDDGTLTLVKAYDTHGLGGVLNGSVADHLASQGSLAYNRSDASLYAVNAGSDTVSVFSVTGDHLALRQTVDSGGTFPVSVAVRGDLVYVLNALDGVTVQGFRAHDGTLSPIPGSARNLGLSIPSDATQFTHTPGQVAFSPDGSQLIVTTKMTGNAIDVFAVQDSGQLSSAPVVNAEDTTVPFAVTFDRAGHLVVADAGTNALATYTLHGDGTVSLIDSVGTGLSATCWVAPARGYFYASNAGSASVSGYQADHDGQLTLLGATRTDPGTVDASASADGRFLYVQTGVDGIVDGFRVGGNGSLTAIGSVTVTGAAGGEGIVAF